MVSMGPNVQTYNFTHKWEDLCKMDSCSEISTQKQADKGSLMDVLSSKREFSKIRQIIKLAKQEELLNAKLYYNSTHTLFVTDDANIPDAFMNSLDLYRARQFIRSYILKGTATIQYLLENGNSVYTPYNPDSPMLAMVTYTTYSNHKDTALQRINSRINSSRAGLKGEITINKVGKVKGEIITTNGVIIIMDNIAMV